MTHARVNKNIPLLVFASLIGAFLLSVFFIQSSASAVTNEKYSWESDTSIKLTYDWNCGLPSCPQGSATLTGSYPTYTAEGVQGDAGDPMQTVFGCLYTVKLVMSTDATKGTVSSKSTGDNGCAPSPFTGSVTVNNDSGAAPTDPAILSKGVKGNGDTKGADSCGVKGLGWLVCPVLGFMAEISDQLFSFLATEFLSVNTELYNTDSPTYQAWSLMRNIANVAFVIAFMIIIFSQVSGVGINNYGIKKMLPRLIVAAILVNLSYLICQIAVDLSNIAGYSIKGLFDGVIANFDPKTGEGGATGNGFGIAVLVTGILAGTVTIALAATVPVLLAVLAALILIVFILLARKALIVLLIVIAPLAFVAYLLPNTEQWFKKWQKMLVALLVVFPVISAIFGASMLASRIVKAAAEKTDDDLTGLLALGIAVIPLIMVPAVLKGSITAAGAIGATMKGLADRNTKDIGGKIGSTSKLGQLNKYRKSEEERRRALMQAGVYEGSNRNPLNWARNANSRLNKKFNKSAISGGFGDRMTASGQNIAKKLDYEKIEDLKNQFNTESIRTAPTVDSLENLGKKMTSDEYLDWKFKDAIKRGDSNEARALYTALQEQGQGGVERLQASLASRDVQRYFEDNPSVMHDLQEHVLTRHADVKGSDSRITNWASTGKMLDNGEHINSLNDGQIATQTESSLLEAEANKTLTAAIAQRVLANPNATNNMKVKQRRVLERVAGQAPAAAQPPQPIPGVNQQNYSQSSGGLYIPHGLNQPPSGGNNSAGGNNNNNGNNNAGTP